MVTSMARQSDAWEIGDVDEDDVQRKFDDLFLADFQRTLEKEMASSTSRRTTLNFLDISPMIKDGVESIVKVRARLLPTHALTNGAARRIRSRAASGRKRCITGTGIHT